MNTIYHHPYNIRRLNTIRRCLWVMIGGLALSGITAFPLETELNWLCRHAQALPAGMQAWLKQVYQAMHQVNLQYPFLSYGTDWLAFAHLILALLFAGSLKDPVKNVWVIQFGLIACILIFPLAFIAGSIRGIPVCWQWVDCSFGVIGCIPLLVANYQLKRMENPEVQVSLNPQS